MRRIDLVINPSDCVVFERRPFRAGILNRGSLTGVVLRGPLPELTGCSDQRPTDSVPDTVFSVFSLHVERRSTLN
jgi:hypothetical protein